MKLKFHHLVPELIIFSNNKTKGLNQGWTVLIHFYYLYKV